jgi:uncharacterized membrane protein
MTDETPNPGVEPPNIGDAFKAGWATFKANAQILVGAFAIFFGISFVLSVALQLMAGQLGFFLMFILSTASFFPTLLLLPGMYLIALKSVRGRKAEIGDLFIMFKDRFVHHLGMLLMQSCGAFVCCIGAWVTQALFVPGSFLVLDKRMEWDKALETCLEQVKPKIMKWLVFNIVVSLAAGAGFMVCLVGGFVTVPVAMCVWAHAYERAFGAVQVEA